VGILKTGGQRKIAEKLGCQPNYVSRLLSGGKNIGDDIIVLLDENYPGWRIIEDELKSANTKVGDLYQSEDKSSVLDKLLNEDPQLGLETGLLKCFRGTTDDNKQLLLLLANKMYEMANPHDKVATPFPNTKKLPSRRM
jgi:transcriptional regulator with XRE-family HTH domain